MLEVVVDALFFAQALDEVQVGLVVLGAVDALGIRRAQPEAVGPGENPVFFEHPGDDLRHAQVLEDALVDPVGEIGQLRHQGHSITGQAPAGLALGDAPDQPVNPAAGGGKGQEGGLVQERLKVQVRALADQFDVEGIGRGKRLAAPELEDLQVVREAFDAQREMRGVGRCEHSLSSGDAKGALRRRLVGRVAERAGKGAGACPCPGEWIQAAIGVRQSSEPEVPETSWVQTILR